MTDATQAMGEKRVTKCENADVPASLTPDVWKHHGFTALRSERGEKVTERQKKYAHTAASVTFGCVLLVNQINNRDQYHDKDNKSFTF